MIVLLRHYATFAPQGQAQEACRIADVTTLLDPQLYRGRWRLELCFRDLKTAMGMEHPRRESPAMARNELLAHLIAHMMRVGSDTGMKRSEHGATQEYGRPLPRLWPFFLRAATQLQDPIHSSRSILASSNRLPPHGFPDERGHRIRLTSRSDPVHLGVQGSIPSRPGTV